jgi:hypothetical protein
MEEAGVKFYSLPVGKDESLEHFQLLFAVRRVSAGYLNPYCGFKIERTMIDVMLNRRDV